MNWYNNVSSIIFGIAFIICKYFADYKSINYIIIIALYIIIKLIKLYIIIYYIIIKRALLCHPNWYVVCYLMSTVQFYKKQQKHRIRSLVALIFLMVVQPGP